MDIIEIPDDQIVYCVKADSFPEGILDAFKKLHVAAPAAEDRVYYGISFPENGNIIYKAAANEIRPGELKSIGLEEFIIQKGNYFFIEVIDYMKNIPMIGEAFRILTADPRIDPNGKCIEWYKDNCTCLCMVRIRKDITINHLNAK